jgi:molecular chaperone GrpE (heat shock protein)
LIENNPKKSNLIDSNSLADLKNMLEDCLEKNLILEKKVKNLHGILEDEVQKNKTLQKRVDDLMQTVDVLNQSAS